MTGWPHLHDYRVERDAQSRRFEQCTGGQSIDDTDSQEYRDYFGGPDSAGRPVEERLTFKVWLVRNRQEQQPEGESDARTTHRRIPLGWH